MSAPATDVLAKLSFLDRYLPLCLKRRYFSSTLTQTAS